MVYNFNGKNIRIPDAEIEKNMKLLQLTKKEAVELWLDDNDYTENAEAAELTAKAKENKINHEAKSDKKRKTAKRERKPDEEKENLIKILADCLESYGFEAKITNKSKIIEFSIGNNAYKLDLIKKRAKKE